MNARRIEIVGGGLAGLSLGLALRRAGVPVTLFEAGDYPRHRVCGEFITGLAVETRTRLGLDPFLADAVPQHEVAWFIGDREPETHRLPEPALGLSRHVLDARLAAAFTAAGGELRTRTRLAPSATRKSGCVLATGRRHGASPWLGLKFHVRGLALARDLELHLGEHAYVGLSHIENDTVNVCGLFRRRPDGQPLGDIRPPALASPSAESHPPGDFGAAGKIAQHLRAQLHASGLGRLANRLAQATIDPASCCAVAALVFDRRVPPIDRIALGDACAMIPPFTGNGMAMAFQSAEAALDPLVRHARDEIPWLEACRETNTALRRRFRVRLASAHALHPFLLRPSRQRWFAALSRSRLLPFRPIFAALH